MDRFKAILRKAVEQKCLKVEIFEGSTVKLFQSESKHSEESSNLSDRDWVSGLLGFLFPKADSINSGDPTKGMLNIPNLGQVKIIAQKGNEYQLSLFLPKIGDHLFQQEWKQAKALKMTPQNQNPSVPRESEPHEFTPPIPESLNSSMDHTIFPEAQNSMEFTVAPNILNNSDSQATDLQQTPEPFTPPPFPPVKDALNIETNGPAEPNTNPNHEPDTEHPIDLFGSPPSLEDSDHSDHENSTENYADSLSIASPSDGSIPFQGSGESEHSEVFSHDYFSELSDNDSALSFNPLQSEEAQDLDDDSLYLGADLSIASHTNQEDMTQHETENIEAFAPIGFIPKDSEVDDPTQNHLQNQPRTQEPIFNQLSIPTPVVQQPLPINNQISTPRIEPENNIVTIDFSSIEPQIATPNGAPPPIDRILRMMIEKKSSDLHLTIDQPIIYRIDGAIERMSGDSVTPEQMEAYLLPIIPPVNQAEFAKNSDTDFAYEIKNLGRFRVNVFRDNKGVGAVMRHIPSEILTAQQLGLPEVMMKLCKLSKGLVLVTGPTGSGKSTTLAAMVDYINKTRADHLITIEDPIEFVHPQQKCLVNQREVGKHTKSFSKALKAALREDPDIVLIGEMRDLETIHIGIETAETGHLVFGTLHTTTAVSTIDRIIDQFPSDQQSQIRMMLASSLKGVIAQTLLPKIGGGRVAAHEILITNDAVGNMIREQKNHMIENHMQTQKVDGNQLLNESLVNLVKNKIVSFDEAYIKAVDKKSFVEMASKKGIKGAA